MKWKKEMNEKIKIESNKRLIAVGLFMSSAVLGLCLQIIGIIEWYHAQIFIWIPCGLFQIYNIIIAKRINKIIWSS